MVLYTVQILIKIIHHHEKSNIEKGGINDLENSVLKK